MQAVHHFFDAGVPVPLRAGQVSMKHSHDRCGRAYPVDVQNVDVARAQLLEGVFDRDVHCLQIVASIVNLLPNAFDTKLVIGGVLR